MHPLTVDAGFFLTGPFDAGAPRVRVTAGGAAFGPACHQLDGGGYFQYADGGWDFTYADAGSSDGDGGCHITSSFIADIATTMPGTSFLREEPQGDGSVVEVFGFTDWAKVDGAVQQVGPVLVDAGLAGPIDFEAVTTHVFCE
ncbi:MAG: hypothetical protein JST54_31445 [Deltaproteobacteria bacterium]|nr:hypothetical protein [Deltaproteobacteria bacterium]